VSYLSYTDWRRILNPRDCVGGNSPWCFETEDWYKAYCVKHSICNALKPSSILEIGVRYGYSAHAFLFTNISARYMGVDLDDASVNSMGEPTVDWAFAMLKRTISHDLQLMSLKVDTQNNDISGVLSPYEFVHIDACHTYAGALRDMTIGWKLATRAMLVDDYMGSPPVHDAVIAFRKLTGAVMLSTPSGTGEALFLK
jgi:hypothetical protein